MERSFSVQTKGLPPAAVQELCQPWVTQPQAGSYRFVVRLVEPIQPDLFPQHEMPPGDIAQSLVEIARAVDDPEAMASLVPDREYRHAMMKLVRNIVPDGRKVREIELSRTTERGTDRVTLIDATRRRIGASLSAEQAPASDPEGGTVPDHFIGILRGLHLDQDWLEISTESNALQRCEISHEVLDDVVGPMVNRRVMAQGYWNRRRTKFTLVDIEMDESGRSHG